MKEAYDEANKKAHDFKAEIDSGHDKTYQQDSEGKLDDGISFTGKFMHRYEAKAFGCALDKAICGHGVCSDNEICVCDEGFLNEANAACSYEQKGQLNALLISVFFGVFGGDWFYLARGKCMHFWAVNLWSIIGHWYCR